MDLAFLNTFCMSWNTNCMLFSTWCNLWVSIFSLNEYNYTVFSIAFGKSFNVLFGQNFGVGTYFWLTVKASTIH